MSVSLDPDEEYPTKQDLIRAGALALISGILGFATTYSIFVRPYRAEKNLAGLDRKGAERSQPAAYRQSTDAVAAFAVPYSGGGGGPLEKRKARLEIKQPSRKPTVAVVESTPTPTPSSLPLEVGDDDYQHRRNSPLKVHSPVSTPQPGSEAPPLPPPRPSEVGYGEAWQRVQTGWVTFGDGVRLGGEGVLVGSDEILTTLSCFHYTGGRGNLGGQFLSTSLAAGDPAHDLALLRIQSGGGGVPVPLCPDGPASEQILICGDTRRPGGYQEVRSRGAAGSFSGFYGWTSAQYGGAPLVNNRGELVALSLPRPPWNSMSWNLAVAAPQLGGFLQSRPTPGGPAVVIQELWVQALRSRASAQPEREAPHRANSKIVNGQAVGNYPLGMTADALRKELGQGQILEQKGGFCRVLYSAPRLTFTLVEGLVVAIETDYHFYTTESGWSVGREVSADELRPQLPGSISYFRDGFEALCSPGLEILFQGGRISLLRVVAP